jgi:hypothetical protein
LKTHRKRILKALLGAKDHSLDYLSLEGLALQAGADSAPLRSAEETLAQRGLVERASLSRPAPPSGEFVASGLRLTGTGLTFAERRWRKVGNP